MFINTNVIKIIIYSYIPHVSIVADLSRLLTTKQTNSLQNMSCSHGYYISDIYISNMFGSFVLQSTSGKL